MEVIRDLEDWPVSLRGGAVAIGNFDGVHRGHARIVERLLAVARQVGGPAVVFTFDPHPVRLLRPEHAPPPLTWTERKAELLGELGVDHVIAYPTDEALLRFRPKSSSTASSAIGWPRARWWRGRIFTSATPAAATSIG